MTHEMTKQCLFMDERRRAGNGSPLLSVIVPVYNAALYLRQCLDGIAAQTLAPNGYEVLLVDDASDDGSLEICREYAGRHSNFYVIPLARRTPGGCGAPSNLGIRNARGTYIGFVDSDDYVCPEMFEELLRKAVAHDADISLCDQYRLDVASNSILNGPDTEAFRSFALPEFERLSNEEKRKKYLRLDCPPWLKIYKASFIRERQLAFPEGDFYFEDVVFHWKSLLLASSIVHVDKKLITHRVNRPGQTIGAPGRKLLGIIAVFSIVKEFLLQTNRYDGDYRHIFLRSAAKRYTWVIPRLGWKALREFCRQGTRLFRDFLWKEIQTYRRTNEISLRTSVKHYLLLRCHWLLARWLPPLADTVMAACSRLARQLSVNIIISLGIAYV